MAGTDVSRPWFERKLQLVIRPLFQVRVLRPSEEVHVSWAFVQYQYGIRI